jgi:hypothetical protein
MRERGDDGVVRKLQYMPVWKAQGKTVLFSRRELCSLSTYSMIQWNARVSAELHASRVCVCVYVCAKGSLSFFVFVSFVR